MWTARNGTRRCAVLAALVALAGSGGVFAQEHGQGGFGEYRDPSHEHFDNRFSHNHAYLNHGYTVHDVPRGGYAINHDHRRYWYDQGEWFLWGGLDWTVASAPVGAFVSVLPLYYTTVMFGGVPYYYANDTYYTWNGGQQGYEVVTPPSGIESASTAQPAPDGQLFVNPRNDVSPEQQANDRYECDTSAADKTGFDPTKPDGGVSPDAAPARRADYFRAEAACLDARGYSVR